MSRRSPGTLQVTFLALIAACASESPPDGARALPQRAGSPPSVSDELEALRGELAGHASLTADELLARRTPEYDAALGYQPTTARNLDLIQASQLSLDARELEQLGAHGFVISKRHVFPHMAYGYRNIYGLDLPVFVSLDAILETVHLSYDAILKAIEMGQLISDLRTLLHDARAHLAAGAVSDEQAAADVDLHFAVALSLLEDVPAAPVRGASAPEIARVFQQAKAAAGIKDVSLFGVVRHIDFTQFVPRGHYLDTPALSSYFRAMVWLGRTDLRLVSTSPRGEPVVQRRQLAAAIATHHVVQGDARRAYDRIDAVVGAFVGEHDYMALPEVARLSQDLGGDLDVLSDEAIVELFRAKDYGAQRIASQVVVKGPESAAATLPLDRSFALLGQRYVVDSHVFSNVVYDRVISEPRRFLPNPLDAAYAALGNDAAAPLLAEELRRYGYAPRLEQTRTLIDAHGEDYWSSNLYNLWLSSLRAVSRDAARPEAEGLPAVARSELWHRRVLNTQLASWAELRHDTLLYVKQSYTSSLPCEFPDGYVDPYPEAFERLRLYALKGREVMTLLAQDGIDPLSTRAQLYFAELGRVATMLRDMAKHELTGQPFTEEQMAFLNDAVRSRSDGCAGPDTYMGWYGRLLFDASEMHMDPTIADVHTDPGGDHPMQVLHAATGLPRLMVVTTDSCEGPRAYAGVVSAYHEVVAETRMTDPQWARLARTAQDVPWMKPLLP